jgi:hypothetical protein
MRFSRKDRMCGSQYHDNADAAARMRRSRNVHPSPATPVTADYGSSEQVMGERGILSA